MVTHDFKDARVLVVGAGGLGCPAAIALAHAGVGTLGFVDDDEVEETNLHRQILYQVEDLGKSKAPTAALRLVEMFPRVAVNVHETRFLPHNAHALLEKYDLVVEGSDNFPTKFLVADACALHQKPVVHGAAIRWVGTAFAVAGPARPCYRCLFEDVPLGDAPNCSGAGVVGPVCGVIGAVQADLALSLLAGLDVSGELFRFDGLRMSSRRHRIDPREDCVLCGAKPRVTEVNADCIERYVRGVTPSTETLT